MNHTPKPQNSLNFALLLTATIDPGEYTDLLVSELLPMRVAEYQSSLEFWLQYEDPRICKIVFCENSGADLTILKEFCDEYCRINCLDRTVEWISFFGNQRLPGFHYGYSELGSIDYALENSTTLRDTQKFIKITGRLTFPTLGRLLDNLPRDLVFAADCHRYPQDAGDLKVRMRTQLIVCRTDFYREYLLGIRRKMSAECSFCEELFMRELWPMRNSHDVVLRFPVECNPRGISAAIGSHYHVGIGRLKSIIRGGVRNLWPNLWL